ncbi:alpha/beta fold hydrolase [Streptomyces echinatus]|uniref:alpha/beta fold hydrolase n=1 Tax=Streptomyces echinatus TaxID=67293 RepID=UPI0037882F27
MATYVLVPGAWLGAWVWQDTAHALTKLGHRALPLSLTGLGERAQLGAPDTDLDTHVQDITDFVETRNLSDVTLVAHSYAAAPVSGAAGRLGRRLRRLVYVDSAPFGEGMSMLGLMPPERVARIRRQVADDGDGWRLPLPPFEELGSERTLDGLGATQRRLLRAQGAPQPFRTFEQPLTSAVTPGPEVDRVVVACHDFTAMLDAGEPLLASLNMSPWRRFDLATGHWPMLSAPVELAAILHEATRERTD